METKQMKEFDIKAAVWDLNPMHWERSEAVAKQILERIPLKPWIKALEYGAGTGITSFILKDHVKEITMVDFSPEMVKIMNNKIESSEVENLKSILFNLETNSWSGGRFDLIMTQMVLHHVNDIEAIAGKFFNMLNPGGFLAIADLYPEDGSFHGDDFCGHKGFNIDELENLIRKTGFSDISTHKCFEIKRKLSDIETKQFDIFLMIAKHR
jgi:tRNA (cmo5U34)-methyltransferase